LQLIVEKLKSLPIKEQMPQILGDIE